MKELFRLFRHAAIRALGGYVDDLPKIANPLVGRNIVHGDEWKEPDESKMDWFAAMPHTIEPLPENHLTMIDVTRPMYCQNMIAGPYL